VDEIARRPCSIPISCSLKLNMDGLLERIWDMMALVRRYWDKVFACQRETWD
jgi:ribosome-interacting GTPase 1